MQVLSINAGSNSLKFAIVSVPEQETGEVIQWGRSMVSGACDDLGKESSTFKLLAGKCLIKAEHREIPHHESASNLIFDWIENGEGRPYGVGSMADIDCIAHRVVHGADQFGQSALISDEVVDQILALEELAPLPDGEKSQTSQSPLSRFLGPRSLQ